MEGAAFLLAVAQIGIVVAGFAGLAASFQDRAHWTPAEWVTYQTLVVAGLGVVFLALLPFIPFYAWHDEQLSLRLASGGYALYAVQVFVRRILALRRAGSPRAAYRFLILGPFLQVSAIANVAFGSMALYVFTLLLALYFATTQFRHFVLPSEKI
jgi:hypothetical protein